MNSKSKYTLILFFWLILIFVIQIIYLQNTNQISKKTMADKNRFVAITGLTDLAFYSNDPYVRHRSLSSRADLFRYDNKLLPFSKGTFSYSSCKIPAL